jgi:thiol:disulfide interchange protein DsbA
MRHLSHSLCALLLALPVYAWASPANPVVEEDYILVGNASPPRPGKAEVVEFFSYACTHCRDFVTPLHAWADANRGSIQFRRVHIALKGEGDLYQRLYYTLDELGQSDKFDARIFDAIHRDRMRLNDPDNVAALVAKLGLDKNAFFAMFGSARVDRRIAEAVKLTAASGVEGSPVVVMGGRYLTGPGFFHDPDAKASPGDAAKEGAAALQTMSVLLTRMRAPAVTKR